MSKNLVLKFVMWAGLIVVSSPTMAQARVISNICKSQQNAYIKLCDLPGIDSNNIERTKKRLMALGIQPVYWQDCYNLDKLDTALSVIESVQKILSSKMGSLFSKDLKVKFFCDLYGGGSYVANQMEIGYRIKVTDSLVFEPEITRNAVAHEYAHSIFDVLMNKRNPVYREYYLSKVKFFLLREQIDSLAKMNSEDPKIELLIAESRKTVIGRSPQVAKIYDLLLPYNELFADVIGVIYAGNGKAMSMVVNEDKEIRDFTKDPQFKTWQRTDSYGAMAPVRAQLGKAFGLSSGKVKRPSEFVLAMIRAIDRQYKELLSKPGYQLDETNVLQANEHLFQLINEEYR